MDPFYTFMPVLLNHRVSISAKQNGFPKIVFPKQQNSSSIPLTLFKLRGLHQVLFSTKQPFCRFCQIAVKHFQNELGSLRSISS